MSCYHPVISQRTVDPFTGEVIWKYNSHKSGFLADEELGEVCIPCGKCIGCRLDYSRSWADRMSLELDHSKTAIFATLTYDNDHLPMVLNPLGFYPSLVKRDCQLFLKKLRDRFRGREIRFYLAGEYGPETHRPHYHVILFGLDLSDFPDCSSVGLNFVSQNYFNSPKFTEIWGNGFTTISPVSWETFAYVSRYVQKKAFKYDEYAEKKDVLPEFALMSRKPGLAGYFFDDHPDLIESSSFDFQNFNSPNPSVKTIRFPKYLTKKLELVNPVLYNENREKRIRFAKDARLLELQGTNLDVISYYEMKEQAKLRQADRLLRKEL